MINAKIVIIDVETGGLNPVEHSILSLGAVILNEGEIVDKFLATVKEPEVSVTDSALKVNGFTKEKIEKEGHEPSKVIMEFESFLLRNDFSEDKIVLAGHNVGFDVSFLKRLYGFTSSKFEKRFSHRCLDTQTGALLLKYAGRISTEATSLDALCSAFGIRGRAKGSAHNALQDAELTAELLKRELKMLEQPLTIPDF
jgi:DNA polymerase-3 subunit epsilon